MLYDDELYYLIITVISIFYYLSTSGLYHPYKSIVAVMMSAPPLWYVYFMSFTLAGSPV